MLESFLNFLFNFFSRFRTPAPVAQQASSSKVEKHIEEKAAEEKKDEKKSETRDASKVKQDKLEYTSLRDQGALLQRETRNGRIMPLNYPTLRRRRTDREGFNYSTKDDGFITSGTSSSGEFITPMSKNTESPDSGRTRTARAKTIYLHDESEDCCCDIVSAFKSCWASLFGSNENPRSKQALRRKSPTKEKEEFMYLPRHSGSR